MAALEQRTAAYEGMLNAQLAALADQLAHARISYATFAAEVNRILGASGIAYVPEAALQAGAPYGGVTRYEAEGKGWKVKVGPGRASGGDIIPFVQYPVGEHGPELFTSTVPGYITPNATANASAPASASSVGGVHFHGPVAMGSRRDADRLAHTIAHRLKFG
jgi:hypothetical protein